MQTFNVKNVDNSLSSYIYIIHVFVVQNNLVLTKTNVIFNPLKQILHSVSTPDQECSLELVVTVEVVQSFSL